MNSLRIEGQKTVGIEIVQQLGWQVPDWIVLPSGNLGNISALAKGLALAQGAGRDRPPAAAGRGAGRARQPALPGLPTRLRPARAGDGRADGRSAIRIGDPVSYERAVRALCRRSTAWWSRPARTSWPTRRRWPTGPGSTPARTPAWRWPWRASWRAAASIQAGQRVVVISTAHGLKFSEFKVGYHEGTLADVVARHRNPPVELPADAGAVRAELDKWLQDK